MSVFSKTSIVLAAVVFIGALFLNTESVPQPATTVSLQENTSPGEVNESLDTLSTATVTPIVTDDLFKVEDVIDGDTIKLNTGSGIEAVRLIGIDTPETVHPSKPVECFGQEASSKTKELLFGKMVRIEKDISQDERDKYGRLLAYIFLEDGTNINEKLIADGYAYEYTYNLPYKYQKEFKQAEVSAQNNKRGLWADDACATKTPSITPVAPTVETASVQNSSQCDPNYSGACVPIASDVDCMGGSGNGPAYVEGPVYVIGSDKYRLDYDGDGVACEKI